MNELGPLVDAFAEWDAWNGGCPMGSTANFLGVLTDLEFLERHHPSNTKADKEGENAPVRTPQVSDGEPFFEFAAIYKAIHAAQGQFVMVELGGGYAARSVDAYQALQRMNPMPAQLVVVEAEPTHFEWVKRHMKANHIDPLAHWLINAAVSIDSNPLLFMRGEGLFYNGIVSAGEINTLVEDIIGRGSSDQVLKNLMTGGRCGMYIPYNSAAGEDFFDYEFVSAMPLTDILAPLSQVDLIDIDIQGAENIVILPAMAMLNQRVKRIHIGTHSDDIHKGLWELFFEHEWICDFDYGPEGQHDTPWGQFETMDGILHFCNPHL